MWHQERQQEHGSDGLHRSENLNSFSHRNAPLACPVINTEYTPCSLEFCPARPTLLTCGLYQTQQIKNGTGPEDLEAPKIERLGRCVLYEVIPRDEHSPRVLSETPLESSITCNEIQRIDCPAILDQRWTQEPEPVLFTADAEGHLKSYSLRDQPERSELHLLENHSCASRDVLCLALDISDKVTSTTDPKVVTSLSNGEIVLLHWTSSESKLIEEARWLGHDFEPWTCGFDYWQPTTILTGGDDCKLKVWDVRSSPGLPVLINKQFEGGVTAVRSHHLREHIFAVGSYDSSLRIFDKRNFSVPWAQQDVGGGIWRLKWHADKPEKLLVAAMHNAFKVVDVYDESALTARLQVQTIFNERSSLAYGADWGPNLGSEGSSQNLVGSCSFYDCAMHFWYSDTHQANH